MLINTFNTIGNLKIEKKYINNTKNEVSFGDQSRRKLIETLKYINDIEKVPADTSKDIKYVANASNVLISNKNVDIFDKTIKGILDDPELKIEGRNKVTAYKTYLRYLNDNGALLERPLKVFPKPELFSSTIAAHITDYLERMAKRDLEIKEKQATEETRQSVNKDDETEATEERSPRRLQRVSEADDAVIEHRTSRERSEHVKSGWQNKLLKKENLGWAAAAMMGTYLAAQSISLPEIKSPFISSSERNAPAQVENSQDVNMPDKVNNSDKIINKVKSGSLILFTLEKNDAQQGDKVSLYGHRFPLYFDQQNQTWGTFLVFPKDAPVVNGKDNYPVSLVRNGKETKRLGYLEVNGRPPVNGEATKAPNSTETNPIKESANSLIITQEPFAVMVKGELVHRYGDTVANGIATDNVIKSTKGSPVIAPARTKIVAFNDNSIILDGGWGLQFELNGVKPDSSIQVGKVVERGANLAQVASQNGEVTLKVTVNGLPTNFFGG